MCKLNIHDTGEQTEEGARRVVEVVLPHGERLQTVDHGAIVTVGGRGQDDEAQADVSPPERRVLVPGHSWELTPSKAESALGWGLHRGGSVVVAIGGGRVGG